ncbi:MAG: M48 family metalloprotease [Acetatifactor sp.]|nr:M48 family metalloprotease [Acetatifactor sp.]
MAIDSSYYVHESDKAALNALKAIPGFQQLMKALMKIWNERQFRILNMSGRIRISENQLPQYYNMLPPICEKLGIDVPDLYLELNVNPNAYTYGDTTPFIVITSGLLDTMPEELIPTVLAHECGHIACHHVLYSTMGRILLNSTSSIMRSGLLTMPLMIAFYYWMRCSELSADRAAVIYDGSADKMSEVCMRFAGLDKNVQGVISKDEFLKQAEEYREIVKNSTWDKTLEFLTLSTKSHPLTAVRALESIEWAQSDQFKKIMDGTYDQAPTSDDDDTFGNDVFGRDDFGKDKPEEKAKEGSGLKQFFGFDMDSSSDGESKPLFDFSKITSPFMKKKEDEPAHTAEAPASAPADGVDIAAEIRKYKALLDDGIITQEEFDAKKKQLLNL